MEITFEGGSGKAEILSPVDVTVADGKTIATVQWSSPNYDYMIVDGEKYLPVNTEGNSVFAIPVLKFDEPMDVIGDTVATFTRIIEHKWFTFGKDIYGRELPKTVISREYSTEWKPGEEPYYPVNDEKNGELYERYRKLSLQEQQVIFGGRLGEYQYYDMDAVVASALKLCDKEVVKQ